MMTMRGTTKFILLFAVVAFLLLLPTQAANDVNAASQVNATAIDLTSVWTEYGNISNFATGSGNTTISISVNTANNYSQARSYLRIKRNGTVLESINLSQSYIPETVTFSVTTAETTGTHYYSWESYCSAGRRCQIYNRTFSVQYLNTGAFGGITMDEVNASAEIPREHVTGQIPVDDSQNISVSGLQVNDTYFNSTVFPQSTNFRNDSLLPISTYNGNYPNTTIAANLGNWNATYNATYDAKPTNATAQITRTQVTGQEGVDTGQNTSITNIQGVNTAQNATLSALQVNDTIINQSIAAIQSNETGYDKIDGSRSWNGDHNAGGYNLSNIFDILDPTGKYYLKNNSVLCGTNTTCTYNANGTVTIASTGAGGGITEESDPLWSANYSTFQTHISNTTAQITIPQVTNLQAQQDAQNQSIDSKTTLSTVNTSAQLSSSAQVTELDTALSGKEPSISSSTASKFWGWDKTFKDILISYVTGLQDTLNSMNSSSAVNNTASQARDDAINSTKLNKTEAYDLQYATGTLATSRLSTNTNATTINFIWDGVGSVLTISNHNISIDYSGMIINAVLIGDTSGNATVNITRTSYTAFPNSFAPLGNISMTSSVKTKDTTLSGWNTSIYADDVINFNLSGTPANLTKLTVKLYVQKT